MTKSFSSFEKICYQLTLASLFVLAIATFTSVSINALSHILMVVPGVYFLTKQLKNRDIKISPSFWSLLALIIICWASVIANWGDIDRPLKQIFRTKYYIIGLLGALSYGYLKRDFLSDKNKALLFKLFLISTTVATICGLIGLWTGYTPLKFKDACHPTRACGLFGMYMTYGYGISLFCVLMTGIALHRKRFNHLAPNWMIWAALIINLAGNIFSYARGGWLGFLLAIPFLFFKSHKKMFLTVMAAGALLLGGLVAFSPKVNEVFLKRQGSNEGRIAFYRAAYAAFTEKPLLGLGFKNFEPNSKDIKKRHDIPRTHEAGHAHSNVLEHLASTGGLGALAFLLFVFFWLKETYDEPILFAFVMSFFISGMTQYTFGDGENVFFIMAIYSLFYPYLPKRQSGSSEYSAP
jgi:O-antigen ligase